MDRSGQLTTIEHVSRTLRFPVGALVRTARPRQWTKNVLVAAAPAAAGMLLDMTVAARIVLAFVAFSLAASGTYFVNDAIDAPTDRLHPRKRHRPVAAGVLPVSAAAAVGGSLMLAGLAVGTVVGPAFVAVVAAYAALTLSYSVWLKRLAVVDIVTVASGFVLRAIGGGVAVDVPLSSWFLIVTSFGALFVVAGKRHGEHLRLGDDRGAHRETLDLYSIPYYQHVLTISSGVTLVAYSLWAYETSLPGDIWFLVSIVPFGTALLRYGLLIFSGDGEEPEEVLLRDRPLQVLGLAWAALVLLGIYGP